MKKTIFKPLSNLASVNIGDANNYFGPKKNFLVAIHDDINHLILNMTNNCVICDKPLGYAGLKPSVCGEVLCTHSHESYGLGLSLHSDLEHNPTVVDMLVSMAVAACGHPQGLDPFPSGIQIEKEGTTHSFTCGDAQKNSAQVLSIAELLPTVQELVDYSQNGNLKDILNSRSPLAFPLLRWIVSSNRSHLAPLPNHIKEMSTDYQFILVSNNPEKERIFRELKKETAMKNKGKGSFYAFHGSPFYNWHSILRIGLKNFSNTKRMAHGAAYGPGIYLAQNSNLSFSYTQNYRSWSKSALGNSARCIALCEVIDKRSDQNLIKNSAGNGIYVVTDENLVTTRYFFFYSGNNQTVSLSADSLKLPENIYSE